MGRGGSSAGSLIRSRLVCLGAGVQYAYTWFFRGARELGTRVFVANVSKNNDTDDSRAVLWHGYARMSDAIRRRGPLCHPGLASLGS